jgi:hypothetical protein
MLRLKEISPYVDTLVSELRLLAPKLDPHARLPDFLRYQWYKPAKG